MCVRTKGEILFTAHPLNGKSTDRLRQPFVPTWGFAGRLTDSAAMCRRSARGRWPGLSRRICSPRREQIDGGSSATWGK